MSKEKPQDLETRLLESEERYRALTRNVPLGIYRRTPGPEGKLVMVNPALTAMFGYDSEEELNEVPIANLYYNPEECETFSNKLFAHREVIREELKMKRRDGAPIWVAVTATVICDEEDQPIYFDGIMEDITEKKLLLEQETRRQEQLLQADKMISLGILVSGVAHEINNPTQFIVSHIEPLKNAWRDALPILERYYEENGEFLLGGLKFSRRKDSILEMFENIHDGTERIKRIIGELRDYARENPADLSQAIYLNDVVKSALALSRNLISKTTSEFFVTYDKEMPPFKGDYQRIEQVIINLTQNACQALCDAGGKISIQTRYDKDLGVVTVQVNDTGNGIPEEHLPRITDPFFTTKRDSGGTGLGLSISQTIVERHGGRLVFRSREGSGTTVKVHLPAAREEG